MTAEQKNRNGQVLLRGVARLEQVHARVGAHRPVVVLARSVHARERLLVQQADEAVAPRHVLHHLHREHLVVTADVRVLEDRRDLVLVRGHLVVAGLDRHAELVELLLDLEHVGQDALRDRAEVVVVQLVALRRLGAEERAPGGDEVGALEEVLLVDQEVLLLRAHRGEHALGRLRRRAASARGPPRSRARPSSAAAASCSRAPRRSRTRTRWGCRAACRSGSRAGRRATWDPRPCSRAPRRSRGCRRWGSWTRPARPGRAPCRRTRRRRCRRRPARRRSRASRRSSR